MSVEPDIVVYAVIAVGLILWLRSILGARHGGERSRPNPFALPPGGAGEKGAAFTPLASDARAPARREEVRQGLDRTMAVTTPQAEAGLADIARAEQSFEAARFLRNAQDAFVIIVEAFAAGDRDSLSGLLGEQTYAAFAAVMSEREKSGQKASVEIHAIRRAEITDAHLEGKEASITVRFVSDQTALLRDAAGAIVQGNPDRVSEAVDVWTFRRRVRSRDPSWLVVDTREEPATP